MNRLIDWYYPFVLAALVLCGTKMFPPVFNPMTRWLFLLVALILAFSTRYGKTVWKTPVFASLIFYLVWCVSTILWSEFPELSAYKVIAAIGVFTGMFSLGYTWMMSRKRIKDALKSFYLFVPAVLLVAVSGKAGQGLMEQGRAYYAGLAGNPNYLGWMMAVSLPFLIFNAFDHKLSSAYRWFFILLTGVCGYYLLLSQSRAAMLLVFFVFMGLLISSGAVKRAKMTSLALFLSLGVMILIPNISELIYYKYILKGNVVDIETSVEMSRGKPFRDSYEAALKGGLMGAGYGISIGADTSGYRGGITAVGYGREKGNSPLAVVEETGIIGFVLVCLIIWRLFAIALKAYSASTRRESRQLIGLFAGLLFGMLIHSNIEAWWVAPGSAESILFWGFAGMSYALFTLVKAQSRIQKIR